MKFGDSAALGDMWGRLGYVVVIIKADLNLGCVYLNVLMALHKTLVKSLWSTGDSYYYGCNKPRCEEMYRRVVRNVASNNTETARVNFIVLTKSFKLKECFDLWQPQV